MLSVEPRGSCKVKVVVSWVQGHLCHENATSSYLDIKISPYYKHCLHLLANSFNRKSIVGALVRSFEFHKLAQMLVFMD